VYNCSKHNRIPRLAKHVETTIPQGSEIMATIHRSSGPEATTPDRVGLLLYCTPGPLALLTDYATPICTLAARLEAMGQPEYQVSPSVWRPRKVERQHIHIRPCIPRHSEALKTGEDDLSQSMYQTLPMRTPFVPIEFIRGGLSRQPWCDASPQHTYQVLHEACQRRAEELSDRCRAETHIGLASVLRMVTM